MKKVTIILMAAILAQACGKGGFNSQTAGLTGGNNSQSSNGTDTGTTPDSEINSVEMKSTVDDGVNAGALALDMDLTKKTLILRVPMAASAIIGLPIVAFEIPQIPGATIQTGVDANGRNAIIISIPMEKFLKGISAGTPGRLPNGDALPYVTRGELPTMALNIDLKKNTKLYLYFGVDQIVAFVETPQFDPLKLLEGLPIKVEKMIFPVKNKRKQTLAYFGFIGSKSIYPGGFYLATNLPPGIVQILDNYFIRN